MEPLNLGAKFSPPVIYLTYALNGEELYHEFPLTAHDLRQSIEAIYERLKILHPGYLDRIDAAQVCKVIQLIKNNQAATKPSSKASRLRNMVRSAQTVSDYNKQIDDMDLFAPDDDKRE